MSFLHALDMEGNDLYSTLIIETTVHHYLTKRHEIDTQANYRTGVAMEIVLVMDVLWGVQDMLNEEGSWCRLWMYSVLNTLSELPCPAGVVCMNGCIIQPSTLFVSVPLIHVKS